MGAVHIGTVLVPANIDQQVEQGKFEGGGVVHGKVTLGIMQDAIGRALPIGLMDEQAVDRHLVDVRVIGSRGGAPGLDLDRDESAILLDEVVRLAGEIQLEVEEGFLDGIPGARIGIDHPPAGEAEAFALSSGDVQQDKGKQEDEEGEVEGGHGVGVSGGEEIGTSLITLLAMTLKDLPGAEGGEQDEGDRAGGSMPAPG